MVPEMLNLAVSWQDKDYVIFFVFFNITEKLLKHEMCFAATGFSQD